jgi:putative hydrolase
VTNEVNNQVAGRLEEVARLLQEQRANPFRVEAYLKAARVVRQLDHPITEIVRSKGVEGLTELPSIGESLARSIHQLVISGRMPMLERLRGESDPVSILSSVPGIGNVTARRLHDRLGIDSLEELEAAAHDGRLRTIAGLGPKRIAGIRDSLATRLGRVRARPSNQHLEQPSVAEILDVDREYRSEAAKDSLPKIAPRRFNPSHEAWLPILHTARGERHYTVVFSNTARAHQFRRTRDWVVIYYDVGDGERQCTVITAPHGLLKGKRIVRGRETECVAYYFPDAAGRAA